MASELEAERRRADQAEQFAATLSRIGAARSLEGALAVLARDAIAILGGEQGAVRAYGLEGETPSLAFWVGPAGELEPADHPETLPGTVAGDLRAGGPARCIDDLWLLEGGLDDFAKQVRRRGMRSSVAVPIIAQVTPSSRSSEPGAEGGASAEAVPAETRRIGSLHVDHSEVGHFGPADVAVAEALAAMAGAAIERAQLEERLREMRRDQLIQEEAAAVERRVNEELRTAIEARDRALAEAELALGLRDKFLSLASHELRTPITSLRGYAQLLLRQFRRGTVDPERLQRALHLIDHQSEKLSRLAMQLLDSSRIESGQLVLEKSPADLAALVRELVESTQQVLLINAPVLQVEHTLTLDAPESLEVLADRMRLEQVVTNLLDNAIKYTPNGGPIQVRVWREPDGCAVCSVQDTGIGVPAAHRDLIFDRFYQVQKRDNPSGMGLGLYVSRQIVEMHGGTLRAEFPPGGGSIFLVEIPAAPPAGPMPETGMREPA